MLKSTYIQLFFFTLLITFLNSCANTQYYHHNPKSEEGVYTELLLNKNGSFEEYLYWEINDSLDNETFGIIITGTYEQKGDSLFLTYDSSSGNTEFDESYLVTENGLYKLEPITYSYHFLNMFLSPGESQKLHDLPDYKKIVWRSR